MAILSLNGRPAHVIDDSNYLDYVGDNDYRLKDNQGNEFYTGCLPVEEWDVSRMATKPFEASGIVVWDEQELKERIEDMWAGEASLMHLAYDFDCLRQQYGQCWIFGTCQSTFIKLLQMGLVGHGSKYRMPSPNSIAIHCYPRNYGKSGGYPSLGVEKYQEHGACTTELWPENAATSRYDTAESRADRVHQTLPEIVECGSGEEGFHRQMCGIAQGHPGGCSWDWWRHYTSSCWGRVVAGELCPGIWNSWGPNNYGDRGFGLIKGRRKYPSWSCLFLRMGQSPAHAKGGTTDMTQPIKIIKLASGGTRKMYGGLTHRNRREYQSYNHMMDRCYSESHPHYDSYGGRGIVVCEQWKNSFATFLDDMGERPEGKCLERIDGNKGYEPDNCKWATNVEQNNNRRNNLILTVYGSSKTAGEWARIAGISHRTIHKRKQAGWADKQAVFGKPKTGQLTIYGKTMSVTAWAEIAGEKQSRVYDRKYAGWTDKQSVFGKLKA